MTSTGSGCRYYLVIILFLIAAVLPNHNYLLAEPSFPQVRSLDDIMIGVNDTDIFEYRLHNFVEWVEVGQNVTREEKFQIMRSFSNETNPVFTERSTLQLRPIE
ncbi:MAG: hypothetical protein IH840_11760 [Candidatus Heimdallarchaeota archaeon]|nr:hypothetical protein [Candidatus Heimdallarchaeota archaeon]